jgi:hypothetical protein
MPAALRRADLNTLIVSVVLASRVLFAAQGAPSPSASDVKAAYLYRFGQFIEAPSRTGAMTVCVAGDNAVAAALEKLSREDAGPDRTVVRRDAASAIAADGCGILFVGRDETHGAAMVKALGGRSTLVVGEDAAFLRAGGMVAFVLQDRKLHFSVNLANAQAAHLKLSSELLKHAAEVIQ